MDFKKLHDLIFEADTPNGKLFDVVLLIVILLSVGVVMMESVPEISLKYGQELRFAEYAFTVIFTVEYVLRLISVKQKKKYIFSFYGIVDVLSILPTFVEVLFPGIGSIRVVRVLRLLRVFRVLKLVGFLKEARMLQKALWDSRRKIMVFMGTVLILVTIMGTMVFMVEDHASGFTSIPRSIYWAIVTVTTVGYGDMAPATALGQTLASIIMLIGYAIIAVPTGIIGAEIVKASNTNTRACVNCNADSHDDRAMYCNKCGEVL